MTKPNKTLALLAYLLGVVGWLYVLLFRRENEFAVYHAKQSMMLTLVAVVTPALWAVVAWLLIWIPVAGPFTAFALFSLVIATYVLLAAAWITGMVYVLRAKTQPIPVVGSWAERIAVEPA